MDQADVFSSRPKEGQESFAQWGCPNKKKMIPMRMVHLKGPLNFMFIVSNPEPNHNQPTKPFGGRSEHKMLTLSDMTPDEFKQARESPGPSQSKMAHQLEVSYQTIQAWEQGRNPISKVVEMAVLHLLNTSIEKPKELQGKSQELQPLWIEDLLGHGSMLPFVYCITTIALTP